MQRINTVNVLGEREERGSGPALLAESIDRNFGVRPDRYVRLDFRGFVELIDAVGGITIDVERVIVDNAYPTEDGGVTSVRFESGVQHMDGARALIYARTRHADDDYHRAERQQQVVSALMVRLKNPGNWPAVLGVLNRYVETDLNLWDMTMLSPSLLLSGGRFERLVIDRDYIRPAEGYSVPDYEQLAPWIETHFK